MKAMVGAMLLWCVVGLVVPSKESVEHGAPDHHGKQPHQTKDGQHNIHFDHEAILGSSKLEQEFDELPPEESKYRLKLLVKKMNKDGNQFITKDELSDWILMSYRLLDKEEAMEEFEEKDLDKDGRIPWEEYQSAQYSYNPKEMADIKANPNHQETKDLLVMVEEDEQKFTSADVNKDGFLDREEYVAFVHPYNYKHMHHIELQRTMTDNDKNKDGFLSMEEFLGEGSHDKEWQVVEEERFKEYDTNKDGRLSMDDIGPWVLNDNKQEAEDEADHLIGTADADEDGKLTEEEILNSHEEFVGSQVTDYGKHLHFIKEEL